MATKIILIRHGQTDYTIQKKYCGSTDIDLNEEGRRQAEKLSKELNAKDISKVYSSDSQRSFNFAKIVFKDTPVEKTPDLQEMNFGVFEGLTYGEIMKKYSDVYQKWLNNPCDITIPGGESLNEMAKRVRRTLTRILSVNKDKTVAIVTHGGPIKTILCNVLNLSLDQIWQIEPALGSVREIEFDKGVGKII
ncbi:MAG: alpha-ribazole phosphatase [Candidatus Omnitrophota bacterium]|nr:MAG: alpha-ribazole phosphatase [Candidatus Omnitrophota bacterium]